MTNIYDDRIREYQRLAINYRDVIVPKLEQQIRALKKALIKSSEMVLHPYEGKGFSQDEFNYRFEDPNMFYNSSEWKDIRIVILKRDNFRCVHCSKLANHVDHLNSAIYYPERCLDVENLISTCKKCHKERHGK